MSVEAKIRALAQKYANNLNSRIKQRVDEMKGDDNSHHLIYRVLGITADEGNRIDIYQNKGRFLYRYAGAFLEEATKICFMETFPESTSIRILNNIGKQPKTFEIDCLIEGRDAIEIKWRDATTDGDHVTKEHTRMQNIKNAGFKPIRVMFYYPHREQAKKIQKMLETLYAEANGEYYYGDGAWSYIEKRTGVDLLGMLAKIANEKEEK